MELIQAVQNEKMMKRIRQIRFVHLQTIVFVAGWFPDGLRIFLYRLLNRLGWTTDYIKFLIPSVFLNYAVFILSPLGYVFLLEDITTANIFAPCFQRNASGLPLHIDNCTQAEPEIFGWRVDPELMGKSKIPLAPKSTNLSSKPGNKAAGKYNSFVLSEMSRISTVGVTGMSETLPHSVKKAIPPKDTACIQDSSIPGLITPPSATQIEHHVVDVHSEPKYHNDENEIVLSENNRESSV